MGMEGNIKQASKEGYLQAAPGILRKTLVHGEKTLLTEFVLAGGNPLPAHRHVHEQTGYLVSGHMVLTIGGKAHELFSGDAWSIPSNVEHSADILEDSVAVEVFSPVREDYLL